METNNRLLKAVFFIVGSIVVFSIIFIYHVRPKEQVFFDHYYDLSFDNSDEYYEDISLNLGYITNAGDTRTVIDVDFPEHPDLAVLASEDNYSHFTHGFDWNYEESGFPHGDIFGHYSVRTVFCQIRILPDSNDHDVMRLTKAHLRFSDGSEMTVDIGQINMYNRDSTNSFFEFASGSSSSDGSSKSSHRVLEDVSLFKIESPLLEKFDYRIEMNINGTDIDDIEGLLVGKDHNLTLSSQVMPADDIIERYTRFDIHPELILSGADGSEQSLRLYNISSISHDYSFIDLYRYVKEKEDL